LVYVVWYRLVEVWCQLFSLVTAVRWYGISVRWYGGVVSVSDGTVVLYQYGVRWFSFVRVQCGVSLWYVFSFVVVLPVLLRSVAACVITECCFGVRYRSSYVLHSECHFVMYSFGAVLCGSFRSSASVCVTCRSLFRVTCGVVLRVSLVFAVRCGIEVVFLTFIVHVSSVVVAACRAPLEVDNPLV